MIKRENIINHLVDTFKKNSNVFAIWLEGSDTTNSTDQFSDIDIWFDVADGNEEKIIAQAQKCLQTLNPLDYTYANPQNHPQIWHSIFHIKDTPDTLNIDFMVQSHSRKYVFTDEEELVQVLHNRENTIQFKAFDYKKQKLNFQNRLDYLRKSYSFSIKSYVEKNLLRANFIDSLYYYKRYALEPLIELSRMKYCPTKMKYGYNFKNLSTDLPKNRASEIENLYRVSSIEDIEKKLKISQRLFTDYLNDLEN